MKNIVIIGGGTGTFTLLSGLRQFPSNNSVIISSADDGGSTGILRKTLGVFPPGDVRQCLVGLSYTQSEMKELFNYRFAGGPLAGHTAGNIIIAALERISGGIEPAISIASKMLNVRGQVLPVSLRPTALSATLKNGRKLVGEHSIDDQNPKIKTSPIKDLKLSPAKANLRAIKALQKADAVIFGPGDLYTSILPNLLVKGIKEAILKSSAKRVLIVNLMTKYGQTDSFKASDFVKVLKNYLGGNIDLVLINGQKPKAEILRRYKKEKSSFVAPDVKNIEKLGSKAILADLISLKMHQPKTGDMLKRSLLRHDSDKLAKLIWKII